MHTCKAIGSIAIYEAGLFLRVDLGGIEMENWKAVLVEAVIMVMVYGGIGTLINWIFGRLQKKRDDIHLQFFKKFLQAGLLILCVGTVGMRIDFTREMTTMLLRSSALFIAIAGFAAQEALADVISGFMLAWNKPFNIGERITLVSSNITGVVEEITMRQTIIRLFDNNRLIVPNSVINKEILMNSNIRDSKSGNFLEVEVSYDSDLDKAMELIQKIIRAHPMVVDKEQIKILIKDFSANGVILKTAVYTKDVNDNFVACSDIRRQILKQFAENGIEIPYPHMDIRQNE